MPDFLHDGAADAPHRLLLAHGAGAAMDSPFMTAIAGLIAARAIAVTRFEFAYMAARRRDGKRRPAPRAETLGAEYLAAVAAAEGLGHRRLWIGGKSMGGRVASLVADELYRAGRIAGLVVLGYPFHPPEALDRPRTAHLLDLAAPCLIVQGERDPFGGRGEVEAMQLSPRIRMHWAGDGDHDLGPRGGSGHTRRGNFEAAAEAIACFIAGGEGERP